MLTPTFDSNTWAAVPFHFWSLVFFVFGSMVGSFLNVCIHRLPLGQSIVLPSLPVLHPLVPEHPAGHLALPAR